MKGKEAYLELALRRSRAEVIRVRMFRGIMSTERIRILSMSLVCQNVLDEK